MKNVKRLVAALLLLCLALSGLATQEQGGSFRLTPKLDYGLGVYQSFLIPSLGADFLFLPWLGLGIEARGWYGLSYSDFTLAALGRLRLGWSYLGVGASFPLISGRIPPGSGYDAIASPGSAINLTVSTGADFPIVQLGSGKLGIDTGMDIVFTDFPVKYIDADKYNFVQAIFAAIFSGIAQGSMGVTMGSIKITVGLDYSF